MEPNPTQRGLAAVVATALADAGFTQRNVAEVTGIPLATLNRRLTGASPFLVTELTAIADMLNTTTSALLATAEVAA